MMVDVTPLLLIGGLFILTLCLGYRLARHREAEVQAMKCDCIDCETVASHIIPCTDLEYKSTIPIQTCQAHVADIERIFRECKIPYKVSKI